MSKDRLLSDEATRNELIKLKDSYDDQTISGANNICGTITLHRRLGRQ